MREFIFVTNHAIQRFKTRYNREETDNPTCIRIIQALVHRGIDFGGNSGKEMYKLNTFKVAPDDVREIVLVIVKEYDEKKKRKMLVVKTILTKEQAYANMSMTTKRFRKHSGRINLA